MSVTLRPAGPEDVEAICAFGEAHVGPHYAPLLGQEAADAQVSTWWNATVTRRAVADGLVLIAESGGALVGVAQRGEYDGVMVIWKLYVHPDRRGSGLGPRLIAALEAQLPPGADRVLLEHFAGNPRAAAFYAREGFEVLRTEPDPGGIPARDVVWRARSLRR